ncbi:MAG: class I SAM-dependent methyltransferase, partial [Candidatus Nitrosotenuis sp.]
PIQLLFAPALVLMLALDIPPEFSLAAFLILLVVYWSTFRTQVPLYLSSNKVWHALESFLPDAKNGFRFIDLGSGLGGVLTHLARVRPDGHYSGVESAPLPFLWSWLRVKLGGYRQCTVQWGSLWNRDLAQYDVVFAYLSPVPMERLWRKARAEMRPGTIFISSTFAVPEQSPHETVQVDDLHRSTLLVWRM